MIYVQREQDRINALLSENPDGPKSGELRAAQQALAWAQDPLCFASPYETVTGTRGGSEDCSAAPHQRRF